MFLSFCVLDDFFRKKKKGFWVFIVHPTVVLVLLSPSDERCFVSRMRDFYLLTLYKLFMMHFESTIALFCGKLEFSLLDFILCLEKIYSIFCSFSFIDTKTGSRYF